MKWIKIYFSETKYITLYRVKNYKLEQNFLIVERITGKNIAYNLSQIYKFVVDSEDW